MKLRYLLILSVVALCCTKDWDWDNPCDPEGTAEPTAPSGLKAVAVNDSTIELTWQDSENEMGYKIERSIDGGPMQEIASVSQDHTRFADTGLKTGHHYGYRVRAFAANGEETKTDTEFRHVFPMPSDLVLTQISDSEIRLEWKDNSVFESGFRVERKEEGGSFSQVGLVGSNVTSYVDKGLHTGNTYTYRIRAFTSTNESAPVMRSIHPAPSKLVLSQFSDSVIRIEWKDNSTSETGFRIERKEGSSDFREVGSVGADIPRYTDRGVTIGTTYTYRICAVGPLTESDFVQGTITIRAVDDLMEIIYGALRLEGLQTDKESYRSGEQVGISYSLVNTSSHALTLPQNMRRSWGYPVGGHQH